MHNGLREGKYRTDVEYQEGRNNLILQLWRSYRIICIGGL